MYTHKLNRALPHCVPMADAGSTDDALMIGRRLGSILREEMLPLVDGRGIEVHGRPPDARLCPSLRGTVRPPGPSAVSGP